MLKSFLAAVLLSASVERVGVSCMRDFPQGFRKSKKFGHWTAGSGGKKTFKRSEQMKKIRKKLFSPRRFYTLYEQKFSNPLLFPKESENLKSLDIGLREVGAKRRLNGVNK